MKIIIILILFKIITSGDVNYDEVVCDYFVTKETGEFTVLPVKNDIESFFHLNNQGKIIYEMKYPEFVNGIILLFKTDKLFYSNTNEYVFTKVFSDSELGALFENAEILSIYDKNRCIQNSYFIYETKCWELRDFSMYDTNAQDLETSLKQKKEDCLITYKYELMTDIMRNVYKNYSNYQSIYNSPVIFYLAYVYPYAHYEYGKFYSKVFPIYFKEDIRKKMTLKQKSDFNIALLKLKNLQATYVNNNYHNNEFGFFEVEIIYRNYTTLNFKESEGFRILDRKDESFSFKNSTIFTIEFNTTTLLHKKVQFYFEDENSNKKKYFFAEFKEIYESKGFTNVGDKKYIDQVQVQEKVSIENKRKENLQYKYTPNENEENGVLNLNISVTIPSSNTLKTIVMKDPTLMITLLCSNTVCGQNMNYIYTDINCVGCNKEFSIPKEEEEPRIIDFTFKTDYKIPYGNFFVNYSFVFEFEIDETVKDENRENLFFTFNRYVDVVLSPLSEKLIPQPEFPYLPIVIASTIVFIGSLISCSAASFIVLRTSSGVLKKSLLSNNSNRVKYDGDFQDIPLTYGKYIATKNGKFYHIVDSSFKYIHKSIKLKKKEKINRNFMSLFNSLKASKYSAYTHCKYCFLEQHEYNRTHALKFKTKLYRCCKCGMPLINYVGFRKDEQFCIICSSLNKYDFTNHGRCLIHLSKPGKQNGSIYCIYKNLFSKGSASKKKKPSPDRDRLISIIKEENWKLNCAMRYEYLYMCRNIIGKELFIPLVEEESIEALRNTIEEFKIRKNEFGESMNFDYSNHNLKFDLKDFSKDKKNEFFKNLRILFTETIESLSTHLKILQVLLNEKKTNKIEKKSTEYIPKINLSSSSQKLQNGIINENKEKIIIENPNDNYKKKKIESKSIIYNDKVLNFPLNLNIPSKIEIPKNLNLDGAYQKRLPNPPKIVLPTRNQIQLPNFFYGRNNIYNMSSKYNFNNFKFSRKRERDPIFESQQPPKKRIKIEEEIKSDTDSPSYTSNCDTDSPTTSITTSSDKSSESPRNSIEEIKDEDVTIEIKNDDDDDDDFFFNSRNFDDFDFDDIDEINFPNPFAEMKLTNKSQSSSFDEDKIFQQFDISDYLDGENFTFNDLNFPDI